MKPSLNLNQTLHDSSSGNDRVSYAQLKTANLAAQPLSFPARNNSLVLSEITPLEECHGRIIQALGVCDQNHFHVQPIINRAIHDCVELDAHVDLKHHIHKDDFQKLMALEVDVCVAQPIYYRSFSAFSLESSKLSHRLSIQDLLGIFKPDHIEVTGSTARSLLSGTGIPDKSKDIDLLIYLDLNKLCKNKADLNKTILNMYADFCGFPQNEDIRKRAIKQFIKHAFGCTFKPIVDTSQSHRLDITFVDISKFNSNKSRKKADHIALWDSLQSSKRILSHDGIQFKTQGLLSLNALNYLHKRGLLVINPILTREKLDRVGKAVEKNQNNHLKSYTLQPQLLDRIFNKSNVYEKNKFVLKTGGMDSIEEMSFTELLNEHAILYEAFQSQELTEYDVKSIEICLAEVAYKQMRSGNRATDNHLILRAQYAFVCGKDELAQKLIHQILSKSIDMNIHPICQVWLEHLIQSINFKKHLPSSERLNYVRYALQQKAHSLVLIQEQLYIIEISSLKSEEIVPVIATLNNPLRELHLLIPILALQHHDVFLLKNIIQRLHQIPRHELSIFHNFLAMIDLELFNDLDLLLSISDLGSKNDPSLNSELWKNRWPHILNQIISLAKSQDDFAKLANVLNSNELHQHISSSLNHPDFEQFVHTFKSYSGESSIVHQLSYLLSTRLIADNRYENAIVILKELASTEHFGLQSYRDAIKVSLSSDDVMMNFNLMFYFLQHLSPQNLDNANIQNDVIIVIEKLGKLKSPDIKLDFDIFKNLEPYFPEPKDFLLNSHVLSGLLNLYIASLDQQQNILVQEEITHYSKRVNELLPVLNLNDDTRIKYEDILTRAQSYFYKREVDHLLPTFYTEKTQSLRDEVTVRLRKAVDELYKISDENAADLVHLSETMLYFDGFKEALLAFKAAMNLGDLYVSHQLGKMIVGLKDPKLIKNEINYFIKYIVQANAQEKPVSLTLIVQLLVAMKANSELTQNFAAENNKMAVRFLTLCKNTKIVENKFECNFYRNNPLNNLEIEEVQAVQWALQALSDDIGEDKVPSDKQIETLKNLFKINQFMHIEEKINILSTMRDTELSSEELYLSKTLSQLLNSQIQLLYRAAQNHSFFQKHFSDLRLIKQLIHFDQNRLLLFNSSHFFTDEERYFVRMVSNILKSCHLISVVNNSNLDFPGYLDVLKDIRSFAHEFRNQFSHELFSLAYNDMIVNLKQQFGSLIPSYLSIQADLLVILAWLINAHMDVSILSTLNKRFDQQHLKQLNRIASGEMVESLNGRRFDVDNAHQVIDAIQFLSKSIYNQPDSGKLFLQYEEEISRSVYAVMQLNFESLVKRGHHLLKRIK